MKKLNLSYLAIYFIVLIVGCVFYYIYGFQPASNKISDLNQQDVQLKGKIADYNQLVMNLPTTRAEVLKLTGELSGKKKFAPMSGLKIAADINTGLQKAGVTLEGITMSPEVISPTAKSIDNLALCTVNAVVKFKSNENQIVNLLHYFEKTSDGVYFVNSLDYSEDAKSKAVKEVTLNITAYYFNSQLIESPNGITYK